MASAEPNPQKLTARLFCASDVCDTADSMEAALKQQPELADKHREIEQVRAWWAAAPRQTAARLSTLPRPSTRREWIAGS